MLQPKERLARRRRRRRAIAVLVVFVFASLSVWGLGLVSYNEHMAIDDVSIAGTNILSPRVMRAAFDAKLYDGSYHLFSHTNVFLFPSSEIKAALLNEFPRIKNLSISRASLLSQAVRVTIAEREPKYSWCAPPLSAGEDAHCYLIDVGGFIFSEVAADATTTGYIFRGGLSTTQTPIGQTFLRGRLSGFVELFKSLESAQFTPTSATIENEKDITVALKEGFYLKVAFGSEAQTVAHNLELITSSDALKGKLDKIEYVDLRFGDRVYYQLE